MQAGPAVIHAGFDDACAFFKAGLSRCSLISNRAKPQRKYARKGSIHKVLGLFHLILLRVVSVTGRPIDQYCMVKFPGDASVLDFVTCPIPGGWALFFLGLAIQLEDLQKISFAKDLLPGGGLRLD